MFSSSVGIAPKRRDDADWIAATTSLRLEAPVVGAWFLVAGIGLGVPLNRPKLIAGGEVRHESAPIGAQASLGFGAKIPGRRQH